MKRKYGNRDEVLQAILEDIKSQLLIFCSNERTNNAAIKERLDMCLSGLLYVNLTKLNQTEVNRLVRINELATTFLNLIQEREELNEQVCNYFKREIERSNDVFKSYDGAKISKRKTKRLSKKQVNALNSWYSVNGNRNYVRSFELEPLVKDTGLNIHQVRNWYVLFDKTI